MKDVKPYDQAIWDWFLPQAVVPSYYGGTDERKTTEVREHLRTCGIDYENSHAPDVGAYERFAGTFADGNDQVAGIVAKHWACRCDEYEGFWSSPELVLPGEFTLSRIIYEVVQNGLGKSVKESPSE